MTELIYFDIPVMWLLPIAAALLSVVCSLFGKVRLLPWISAALHGIAVFAVIYFGGGLTDIFVMLLISLIASCVCAAIKNKKGGTEK